MEIAAACDSSSVPRDSRNDRIARDIYATKNANNRMKGRESMATTVIRVLTILCLHTSGAPGAVVPKRSRVR